MYFLLLLKLFPYFKVINMHVFVWKCMHINVSWSTANRDANILNTLLDSFITDFLTSVLISYAHCFLFSSIFLFLVTCGRQSRDHVTLPDSTQLTSSVTTVPEALWSRNWPVELSWVESDYVITAYVGWLFVSVLSA